MKNLFNATKKVILIGSFFLFFSCEKEDLTIPENNPEKNEDVFKFPTDPTTHEQTTFSLNQKPYIEVSAGVANIFKLVRIDVVKRLTYADNPNVSQWGIRSRLKFDF